MGKKGDAMTDTPCPCIVTFASGTAPLTIPVINYCPMHAAAADLLAALEGQLQIIKNLNKRSIYFKDSPESCNYRTLEIQSPAIADAAISQARGE